jgi:hypothetical protein
LQPFAKGQEFMSSCTKEHPLPDASTGAKQRKEMMESIPMQRSAGERQYRKAGNELPIRSSFTSQGQPLQQVIAPLSLLLSPSPPLDFRRLRLQVLKKKKCREKLLPTYLRRRENSLLVWG